MWRTIILIALLAFTRPFISAFNIKAVVVDAADGEPLPGASVNLVVDGDNLANVVADKNGGFKITCPNNSDCEIVIDMMGYKKYRVTLINPDGGDMDWGYVALRPDSKRLNEVTVTAEDVIQKADRYILFPSESLIERSNNSIALLGAMQMKMPGLQVNEALESVTLENRSPLFQINGKPVSFDKIRSINPDNIIRIEYHNTPDIRYATQGIPGVINIIMKPIPNGGSVYFDTSSAITTTQGNEHLSLTYYNKKSEWSLFEHINWRDYKKNYLGSTEEFINGHNKIVNRDIPMPYKENNFNLQAGLGYSYQHNLNTIFSANVFFGVNNGESSPKYGVDRREDGVLTSFLYSARNKQKYYIPKLDFFFKKQFKNGQSVEWIGYGNFSDGEYDNSVEYIYPTDIDSYYNKNRTDNGSYVLGTEGVYSKAFKNVTLSGGVNYIHRRADNKYNDIDGYSNHEILETNNLYVYGSATGRAGKFGYSAGVGGQYYDARIRTSNSINSFKVKVNASLNWQLPNNWSLNYVFIFDPSQPKLGQQSEIVREKDDLAVTTGAINIKPSSWMRNRIYLRNNYKKLTTTLWLSHSRTFDPIYQKYVYIDNQSSAYSGKYLGYWANGDHDDRVNLQLDMGLWGLFSHWSIWGTVGWDYYSFPGYGSCDDLSKVYGSINLQVYYGNWTAGGSFMIAPTHSLSANIINRQSRYNSIYAEYRLNNWYFKISALNPFTKRGSINKFRTISDVHPVEYYQFCEDNANQVSLGVTYRVNFGKGFKRLSKTLKGQSVDTGVGQ